MWVSALVQMVTENPGRIKANKPLQRVPNAEAVVLGEHLVPRAGPWKNPEPTNVKGYKTLSNADPNAHFSQSKWVFLPRR